MAENKLLISLLIASLAARAGADDTSPDCSGLQYSSKECTLARLQTRPLRVLYLEESSATENRVAQNKLGKDYVQASTFVAENWAYGWMGAFMWGIFTNYLNIPKENIVALTTLNFTSSTDPNNATSVYHGASSFTRCVWEVKLGNVDICVGDFWETTERREIVQFTTPIDVDKLLLITTPENADASTTDLPQSVSLGSFSDIFMPFTWQVWVLHLTLIIVAGTVMLFIESTGVYMREHEEAADNSRRNLVKLDLSHMLESMWRALIHFHFNGPQISPRTLGGTIALFGLSFHCLIITAAYTASVSRYLSLPTPIPLTVVSLGSLQQSALNNYKGRLCVLQAAQGLFTGLGASRIVGMDNYGPLFEKLYTNKCGAAVVGKNEYLIYVQASQIAFTVCADPNDPYGFLTCQDEKSPSKLIDLANCDLCEPSDGEAVCEQRCPNLHRYKDIMLSDQEYINLL